MKANETRPGVVFFTVTRSQDYDYLLGSIEHHARMGFHVVIDTTLPEDNPKTFRNLPKTVIWIHEPIYGSGWKTFRFVAASKRALEVALELKRDVLIWLDSDEFFASSIMEEIIPLATRAVIELAPVHWRKDGHPYLYGESEWHKKIWPRWANLSVGLNLAWPKHKDYNGNPEHHALVHVPPSIPVIRVPGLFRHHVHYAIGPNKDDEETGKATIDGWDSGGHRTTGVDWPTRLALWRDRGIPPSEGYL